jgi:hypothetical protein
MSIIGIFLRLFPRNLLSGFHSRIDRLVLFSSNVFLLIKMYQNILYGFFTEEFLSNIGSLDGITPGSRENSLYNAIWVAQALLRKGYVSLEFMLH